MDMSFQDRKDDDPEFAHLTLEGMGTLGDTLSTYEGDVINVFGGIPGEEVVARLFRYKRRRRAHVSGVVTEVLKASSHRVAPPCPYFGPCSGCQWQHIEYSHQLQLKRNAVVGQLGRYPELEGVGVSPTVPSPQLFNYRNHARLTVRAKGSLGFTNRITRRFVKVDECMLMAPWINRTLKTLQGTCQETTQLSMRYGVNTGDWLIQPALYGEEVALASGQSHYREELLGHRFRVSSPSFFQVNTKQAEQLAGLVRARLELGPSSLLVDAYAGVGTFAALLAPFVERVIAIEESASAMKDAAINTIGIENLEFIAAKTEEALDCLDEKPDAIILDPPRAGCDPRVLNALVRKIPRRVVYVSCDPETLARDLHLLVRGGFRVAAVEPVDMFPQTHHVECVATLKGKDS